MAKRYKKYSGLCSTCRNAPVCTFRRDSQNPSLYCEEFEIDTDPLVKTALNDDPVANNVSVNPGKEDSNKFTGLCKNCDNRMTCIFPKPEGGIWHCEEYR